MKRITLFLLAQKGLATARVALHSDYLDAIDLVVIGEDRNLQNDCSEDIRQLCIKAGIQYVMRREYIDNIDRQPCLNDKGRIGIASGWRWLLKEDFDPLIVIHDSLLPKYRGFNPLVTALLNRDHIIGATAIVANMEFDRGNIIDARAGNIAYPISIFEAMETMSNIIENLTIAVLERIKGNQSLEGTEQDEALASYSVWRDNDDYWVDWTNTSEDICHFINCVSYPYAGASTSVDGETIRISKATPIKDVEISNRYPGKVLFVKDGKPIVICGKGLIRIDEASYEKGGGALSLPRFRIRFKRPAF